MERTLETITINNALEVVRLKGELKFKHPLGYTRPSGYCFKHPVKGFPGLWYCCPGTIEVDIMDFGKYEKYMNDRKAVTVENNRRIEKKFAECEKWVADNLINCGCVFTNHSELLQKQSFMIWIDNGISISHKIYKLSECGITPLVLLPYPVRI